MTITWELVIMQILRLCPRLQNQSLRVGAQCALLLPALQVILMPGENCRPLRYTGRSVDFSPGFTPAGSVALGKLLMAQSLGFLN